MNWTRPLVILMLFGLGSFVCGQTSEPKIYNDVDAYDVYSAVLSLPFNGNLPKSKTLLIRQDTIRSFGAYVDQKPDSAICLKPTNEITPLVGPAIEDFLLKNETKWRLQNRFNLETPYKLIDSEQVLELIKRDGWEGFNKAFPESGAFIDLSAVGFNADKTIAVVSKGGWCGELCGEGAYYIMQKKQGKWVPVDWRGERCSWVS